MTTPHIEYPGGDEHTIAATLLMEMTAQVIHDGTGTRCPGCSGADLRHDDEEALAA